MKTFRQILIYWIIGLFVYLFISPFQAVAAREFQADYNVDYTVAPSGTTIVTQNVTLTNLQTNLYPKQYSITIDTEKIRNVIARDSSGIIEAKITQHDGKTDITLPFNSQIVGLGKQLAFTLRYENLDVAQKEGTIWEVNIPGVTDSDDLHSYQVSLEVPSAFGPNAYMSPLPGSGRTWNKDQMIHGGISVAYGTKQAFSLSLSYYLENSNVTNSYQEIALPPDTAYQSIIISSLVPQPNSLRRDSDGNWIARFDLSGGQKMTVVTKIIALLSLTADPSWQEQSTLSEYLKAKEYWNTSDPTIIALAQKYKTPREIYNYVVSSLNYDYNRVNQNPIRKGASEALKTPKQSVCMEFTDLFIAIARAAGIPAREMVGYAYTTNVKLRPLSLVSDVLHAWPAYYDKDLGNWVEVDPTWENTTKGVNYFDKLDFNHIVFAIHGISSSTPYPAGFYHKEGKPTKDVDVRFLETPPPQIVPKLTTHIEFPGVVTAGIGAVGSVVIQNTSGVSVPRATIVIQTSPYGTTQTHEVSHIPPFAKFTYDIASPKTNYITSGQGRISVSVNSETTNATYKIRPMYWLFIPLGVGFISVLVLVFYIVYRKKTI